MNRLYRTHVDEAYARLVQAVLQNGTRKENRTGVDTLSTFGQHYTIDLQDGFPLLTTKAVSWKNIVIEMLWFLSGQTDIGILQRHKCKFWDAWADPETGKVPSAYGAFWRNFPTHSALDPMSPRAQSMEVTAEPAFNDQIAWVLDEMKRNPMSRRMVVSAWAPGNAQTSKLPPCHSIFAFNVQNEPRNEAPVKRLCLSLWQRSADIFLGVPYNIASYALLVHLFSRFSGIEPGIFSHTLVDAHIYCAKPDGSMAEYDQVAVAKTQIAREPRPLPKLVLSDKIKDLSDIEALMHPSMTTEEVMSHFILEGYDPWPALTVKVAV